VEAKPISALSQPTVDLVAMESEQLTLLSGHSIAARRGELGRRLAEEAVGCAHLSAEAPATVVQVLDLVGLEAEQPSSLADLEHPVTAYLNGLAPSSRRPQLAALESIARRSTQVFTAETMPWQLLRRHQVLKIRSLLEENYLPATANRMLSALRGVFETLLCHVKAPFVSRRRKTWRATYRLRQRRTSAFVLPSAARRSTYSRV
jgi:hypothetical protein